MERALATEAAARRAAGRLAGATRAVVLARGMNYPTAWEIALKLKELALLLAEPYSSADFQHGPIAMAERRLPAIVVSPRGSRSEAELDALAARLRAGRSPVVSIGPSGPGSIPLPDVPELLSPLVAVIPGQLLAFHAARERAASTPTTRAGSGRSPRRARGGFGRCRRGEDLEDLEERERPVRPGAGRFRSDDEAQPGEGLPVLPGVVVERSPVAEVEPGDERSFALRRETVGGRGVAPSPLGEVGGGIFAERRRRRRKAARWPHGDDVPEAESRELRDRGRR